MTKPETFWEKWQRIAIQKEISHSIHCCRTNPDYQKNHPNEVRDNPKHLKQPHPEAVKRIKLDIASKTQGAFSPIVKRPERFNK